MLTADTVLQGRYRIVRQLGQGGMGAVYEAVDERLDTIVALKETLFTDEKLRKQFEREARLLARMHHPALPRVSDHFNEADGQFLVMQYIAGEDLSAMLAQRNGPFPQEEVLRWADQLCDALDYLHTQDPQIIHRDIKPQNLKLTARGQIVLLDFGLAKGSAGQMSVVTTSASIFGYTPNYAPLEQVQGLGTDPRSDIYALAATLFHLMTNVKPPDALSRASAIVNGLPDPLPLANHVTPQVGAAVAAVLSKGMSQKRDDRFASASAMRDALRVAAEHPLGDAATVLIGRSAANRQRVRLPPSPRPNSPAIKQRPWEVKPEPWWRRMLRCPETNFNRRDRHAGSIPFARKEFARVVGRGAVVGPDRWRRRRILRLSARQQDATEFICDYRSPLQPESSRRQVNRKTVRRSSRSRSIRRRRLNRRQKRRSKAASVRPLQNSQ